jgi:hypothetical protein
MTKGIAMSHPTNLSKSKLVAYRQCPRRLWLEIHRPELRQDSTATLASFASGYAVGDVARRLYDPEGTGTLIDVGSVGYPKAFALTQEALAGNKPIFEAGFAAHGALAFADVMLPMKKGKKTVWRMVEVKSSSEVKDYHRDDVAIQTFVARQSGVPLIGASVAHVDTEWIYPGGGDYRGLLVEEDVTDEAFGRSDEVKDWIAAAHAIAKERNEPVCHTGDQCSDPFDCGFFGHCRASEPVAEHPVEWLPRIQTKALKEHLANADIIDLAQVPDKLLNAKQLRVKQCTLENKVYFDAAGAGRDLAPHTLPGLFLDFETIRFVVPIWAGTRPYQQIPFQFSCHVLGADGKLTHTDFLDLSGNDPSEDFSEALLAACQPAGPIFVYNKGFEGARIRELAERYSKYRAALLALLPRLVDLLPITGEHYYHPDQQGSWSIKKVLPAMAPELRYDALEGVQDGGAAMTAYTEAIAPNTSAERKAEIKEQLLAYCGLDTFAMIRVWSLLAGRAFSAN